MTPPQVATHHTCVSILSWLSKNCWIRDWLSHCFQPCSSVGHLTSPRKTQVITWLDISCNSPTEQAGNRPPLFRIKELLYFDIKTTDRMLLTTVWEAMKAVIRGTCISKVTAIKRKTTKESDRLLLEIRHKRDGGKKTLRSLNAKRAELAALETSKISTNLLFLN